MSSLRVVLPTTFWSSLVRPSRQPPTPSERWARAGCLEYDRRLVTSLIAKLPEAYIKDRDRHNASIPPRARPTWRKFVGWAVGMRELSNSARAREAQQALYRDTTPPQGGDSGGGGCGDGGRQQSTPFRTDHRRCSRRGHQASLLVGVKSQAQQDQGRLREAKEEGPADHHEMHTVQGTG